jgi:hypothetical protein
MAERIRARLTYANVMATVAVFIALGGASYAALKVPRDSIGPRHLKNPSVGEKELKDGAVTEPKLDANAVSQANMQGNAVGPDQLAPDAVSSRHVDNNSLDAEDLSNTAAMPRLFAHVSSSGVLGESAGVQEAGRISKGQYFVRFNRELRGCVATATVGFGFGPGVIGAGGIAQARMNLDNDPSKVGITVYRKGWTFNDVEDNDTHLIVAC